MIEARIVLGLVLAIAADAATLAWLPLKSTGLRSLRRVALLSLAFACCAATPLYSALSATTAAVGLLLFLREVEGAHHRALVATGVVGTLLMHGAASLHSGRFPSVAAAALLAGVGLTFVASRLRAPLAAWASVGAGVFVFGFLGMSGALIISQGDFPCFGDEVFPLVTLETAVMTNALGAGLRRTRVAPWVGSGLAVTLAVGTAALRPEPFDGLFVFPTLAAGAALGFELGRATFKAVLALFGRPPAARTPSVEFLFSIAVMQACAVVPVRIIQELLSHAGC